MTHILVVEDDLRVGAVLELGLREEGFQVDRVYDGEQAIARASNGNYDLVLLDFMLPGKSGPEVAQALRDAGRRGRGTRARAPYRGRVRQLPR